MSYRVEISAAERVSKHGAAAILGVSPRLVVEMSKRGELPTAAKIAGRWSFDEKALRAFVRKKEEESEKQTKPQMPAIRPKARYMGASRLRLLHVSDPAALMEQANQRAMRRLKKMEKENR